MLGFLLKNLVYALMVSLVFYLLLIFADVSGIREINEKSFSFASVLVTVLTFNISILNQRLR